MFKNNKFKKFLAFSVVSSGVLFYGTNASAAIKRSSSPSRVLVGNKSVESALKSTVIRTQSTSLSKNVLPAVGNSTLDSFKRQDCDKIPILYSKRFDFDVSVEFIEKAFGGTDPVICAARRKLVLVNNTAKPLIEFWENHHQSLKSKQNFNSSDS